MTRPTPATVCAILLSLIPFPGAGDTILLESNGPIRIVAMDSGSVVSTERFQTCVRRAFQGRALAIVRATGSGVITVTARAAGLAPATVELTGKIGGAISSSGDTPSQ